MNAIPTQQLKHEEEEVFFAFRTMEENHLKAKGEKPLPHRHDFYTVLLVKNACGSHFIDYEEFKMKPQTIFFVAPGQVHQVVVNSNDPSGDILMFSDEFLSRNFISAEFISNLSVFACGINTPPIDLPTDSFHKICTLSNEISKAFISNSPFKFDEIAAYLILILIECNQYAAQSHDQNPQNIQSGRQIIKEFRQLLELNIERWHKVHEYADEMNISADYLNNVVKSNIGKTAKELINSRIVLEAKRLGLHTDLTTKEIAYQLGYDDPSHFSKFFKKETQQAFTNFRAGIEGMKVA